MRGRLPRQLLGGGLAALLIAFLPQLLVRLAARGRTFDRVEDLPGREVGLVLGTGKYLKGGRVNRYYRFRLDAAETAFRAGKVERLLLSGSCTPAGDEPEQMREDLVARGLPPECLILDRAGWRTLESVVGAGETFGLRQFTVISQPFHNERAIFLARSRGLDATDLNARDVTGRSGLKVQGREGFARMRAVLDVLRQARLRAPAPARCRRAGPRG